MCTVTKHNKVRNTNKKQSQITPTLDSHFSFSSAQFASVSCPKLLSLENSFEFIWNLKSSFEIWKEYLPNVLVSKFWGQIFVYWARYFKFWLLAYFFILLNCAKFEEDWTTFILHILQGSPLWIFGRLQKKIPQISDLTKMWKIQVFG